MDPARHVWYGMAESMRIEETMMTIPIGHKPCPGCKAPIRAEHMCCWRCWEKVPITYRRAYTTAYAGRFERPGIYTLAKTNVVNWLKHHKTVV